MAGIWDEWGAGSNVQTTFSIITTGPNEEMAALHNRMPLILASAEAQVAWLSDLSVEKITPMLQPPANGLLRMYRVSERLNGTSYDAPELQDEVPDVLRLF